VGATIRALLPQLRERRDRGFLDRMLHQHSRALEDVVEAYTHGVDTMRLIHPEYAARVLDEESADDAVSTVDTGMCCSGRPATSPPTAAPHRGVVGPRQHGQRPSPRGRRPACSPGPAGRLDVR
jgi:pyruvate dehydrogenase (quinone)